MKRPIFIICIIFSAGILFSWYFPLPILLVLIISAGCLVLSIILNFLPGSKQAIGTFFFMTTLFCFGCFWQLYNAHPIDPLHIANQRFLFDHHVIISGTSISEQHLHARSKSIEMKLDHLLYDNRQIPVIGKILVYLPLNVPDIPYGSLLQISGKFNKPQLPRNPGAFNFAQYLAQKNIFAIFYAMDEHPVLDLKVDSRQWFYQKLILPLRHFIIKQLDQLANPATAGLLKGLLLGDKHDLPDTFLDALSKTGTSHILAVSGLHTGFILLILWIIFSVLRLPRWAVTGLTLGGLIIFAHLTHLKPSVIRAVIMASIFLIGQQFQRFQDNYNSLAAAALIILLANPQELFNPGFQLSFGAVLSILYFYPKLSHWLGSNRLFRRAYQIKLIKYPVDLFLISLAVQIGTLPIATHYFYLIPVLGVLANILVVPGIGLMLALGFTALGMGCVSTELAMIYMEVNQAFVFLLTRFIQWMAAIPGSHIWIPQPELSWILIYFNGVFLVRNWKKRKLRIWLLTSLLLLANFINWKSVLVEESTLRVTFFDVGQGDAILLEFPNNQTLLIDGGKWRPDYNDGERVILPYLRQQGIRHLDYVLVTHPHNDHLGGILYLLRNFPIRYVFDNGDSLHTSLYLKYRNLVDSLNIPRQTLKSPDILQPGPLTLIRILNPVLIEPEKRFSTFGTNNRSVVCYLNYGKTSFLFAGDAEKEAENQMLGFKSMLNCDVLKVGHHGSATSTGAAFLNWTEPVYAIISVGHPNRFDQPARVTLERLNKANIRVFRTDLDQAIVLESDGERIQQIIWQNR